MGNTDQLNKIEYVAKLFKQSKNTVAFTGAGISTDSGIPDFRSTDFGLWNNVDPMSVASIQGFKRNPQSFYDWVRPLARKIRSATPNAAHIALARLEQMGYLQNVVTQNIDMLHTRAGNKQVYELHGHLRSATCIYCYSKYNGEEILFEFLEHDQVPLCNKCGGPIKPDIILFGEQLPIREFQNARYVTKRCDLMLIIGSSLEIAPASDFPVLANRSGARLVVVNLATTFADKFADVTFYNRAGEILPQIVYSLEKLS